MTFIEKWKFQINSYHKIVKSFVNGPVPYKITKKPNNSAVQNQKNPE